MASKDTETIEKVNAFIKLLRLNGIDIHEAYLFGSMIEGRGNPESDIDVAVVSKDFVGTPFYDVQRISKFRRAIDLRIEVHPFALHDIEEESSPFYLYIREKGIQLA